MANSFLNASQNMLTRKFGTTYGSVDPYISGYFFCEWTRIPGDLGNNAALYSGRDPLSVQDIIGLLNSLTMSVNIPGRTVNKTEIQGLGGLRWTAPTNIDEDTNMSMRFIELQDLPIHRIMHAWTRLIRDNKHGFSNLTSYTKSNYVGTMYYWTTTPDSSIQFYSCYAGLYPLKDPNDIFSHDLASNDRVDIDIDFSVDTPHIEEWVRANVEAFMSRRYEPTLRYIAEGLGTNANSVA